ncbi:MAG: hypothetical protein WCT77_00700 [Bacteroidota bacterium]
MSYTFTKEDIKAISNILECEPQEFESSWSWHIENEKAVQPLFLSVHNNVKLSNQSTGPLISVQTRYGYFELHDCSSYLLFEPDEVIFVQSCNNKVSSMIVGKSGNCSLYSNIDKNNLNTDFSGLDPVVLLSAMQLSLAESVL